MRGLASGRGRLGFCAAALLATVATGCGDSTSGGGGEGASGGEPSSGGGGQGAGSQGGAGGSGASGGGGQGTGGEGGNLSECGAGWGHAYSASSSGASTALVPIVDSAGNVITGTAAYDFIDFGSGPMTTSGYSDQLLAKWSPSGELVWAHLYGGTGTDEGRVVAIDPNDGIFLAGVSGSASIDFGGGARDEAGALTLAKLSAAGDHVWSKRFASHDEPDPPRCSYVDAGVSPVGLGADETGSVYVALSLYGCVDLGDGLLLSEEETEDTPSKDLVLAKLTPDGDLTWAEQFGGPGMEMPVDLSVRSDGAMFLSGWFDDELDLGTGNLTQPYPANEMFISKLDADGHAEWVRQFHSTAGGLAMIRALDEGAIVAGYFSGQMDLGDGPLVTGSPDDLDLFIARYDEAGDLVWKRSYPVTGAAIVSGLAVDPSGTIVLTGSFGDTIELGSGPITASCQHCQEQRTDAFVVAVGLDGSPLFGAGYGDPASQYAYGAAWNRRETNGFVLGGWLSDGEIDFGGGALTSPAETPAAFLTDLCLGL